MEKGTLQIEQLTAQSIHLLEIAQWVYEEWWQSKVAGVEVIANRLREQNQINRIPLTLVAISGSIALGCASIVLSDMQCRPQLSPWLATLFVRPEFRRQGIGTALVDAVVSNARAFGVERLYLATPDKQGFYSRLGWHVIERDVGPRRQTIMGVSVICRLHHPAYP